MGRLRRYARLESAEDGEAMSPPFDLLRASEAEACPEIIVRWQAWRHHADDRVSRARPRRGSRECRMVVDGERSTQYRGCAAKPALPIAVADSGFARLAEPIAAMESIWADVRWRPAAISLAT